MSARGSRPGRAPAGLARPAVRRGSRSGRSWEPIYAVVRKIPRGRVATYGQVAALAGFARAPRVAGYALYALPEGTPIPWHRVVAAQGRLSLGRLSPEGALTQRMRLENEGVSFDARGRVRMERHAWRPGGMRKRSAAIQLRGPRGARGPSEDHEAELEGRRPRRHDTMNIPAPEKQLAGFIAKFTPETATLIREIREKMRERLPQAVELVYDNYNFFVIGYGPSERASEAIFSLAAQAKGVSLCFLQGAGLPDPKRVLRGSGNVVRNIQLETVATLDRADVRALMKTALERAKAPLDPKCVHRLIIKSVSAKQRPRRPVATAKKR